MLPAILAVLLTASPLQSQPPNIVRDTYGVPRISATSLSNAFFQAGYAVAQDRLWQMETSRRLARGRMAEVFGSRYSKSDAETLRSFYTDDELHQQYANLSDKSRAMIDAYVQGVNAWIDQAKTQNKLPEGYASAGFQPEPWTKEDSLAIGIRLFQLFGRGGAGELRNMALLSYLGSQPNAKNKLMDIFDDLLWQNDPTSIPTIPPKEDALASNPPLKVHFDRAQTERQLAELPKLGLFDLLPALQHVQRAESTRVAQTLAAPFKTGSYCVIVGPDRSALGAPLLLSGPQMGHTNPAIVHEMSINAGPGLTAAGMDIPGFPGVAVGMTPDLAWGLTSGVADTEDIFDFQEPAPGQYLYAGATKPLEVITRTLKVKGEPDQQIKQQRTPFGPVILETHNHLFVRRSAYWMKEMKSFDALAGLYDAKTADQVEHAIDQATMNFNFFYVMKSGDFGYRYVGNIPIRAEGLDPRLPTIAKPENDWHGFLRPDQLPHVRNPRVGVLANWNNKPAAWWPNYDTPVWGEVFRNAVLLDQVKKPKLTSQDLEQAAWSIARLDDSYPYFAPYLKRVQAPSSGMQATPNMQIAAQYLRSFDGRLTEGSIAARVYVAFMDALRNQLFLGTTGNFLSPDLFRLAAQPTVMLHALQRKTKVNYLGKRSVDEVLQASLEEAVATLSAKRNDYRGWAYLAGGIPVPGQVPVPYSNRGSYIQVVEMMPQPVGRNVLPPGVAESGDHAYDQVPLARAWTFKPFGWR